VVGKNSAHNVAPSPVPCRSGNAADSPNRAVGGQVEVVIGAGGPEACRWPGLSDVGYEDGDGGRGVASHAASASADARPSTHIRLATRAHAAERMDQRYRGSAPATPPPQ
jgi:hypothetical protein